ncbi:MAG: 4-hydroxy-tetrahydrodipicolinate reductase [Lysobacterales bacterium]
MPNALPIAVLGAAGRMGLATVRRIAESTDLKLSSALVRPESDAYGSDIGVLAGLKPNGLTAGNVLGQAQVLIDFSSGSVLNHWLPECAERGIAVVSGTTALTSDQEAALDRAATKTPVLWSANMSLGVALLSRLCRQAASVLGQSADIEIVEAHHRDKKDSPSGTALALASTMATARGQNPETTINRAREGDQALRVDGEIGIAAIRGGQVIGDHTVHIAMDGERLELTHRAGSREAFVDGALRAARWIADQKPGRYTLDHVMAPKEKLMGQNEKTDL